MASPLPSQADTNRLSGWKAGLAEFLIHSGTVGLALALLDALLWVGLYAALANIRHRYAMDDPLTAEALMNAGVGAGGFRTSVCVVQFATLALCLFIAGGYDRRTSYLSLGYMSEHLIALIAAGVLGGLFIYAGAAFSMSGMRPSRGVFLSSLMAFAPLSLMTRRALGQMLRAHLARSFLVVLGRGDNARKFHESYQVDGEHQPRLCFVDPPMCNGQPAGGDSEMELEKLAKLAGRSRGVVVIEDSQRLRPDLLEWLTRLHYQDVPV